MSTEQVGSIEYVAGIDLQEFVRHQRDLERRLGEIEKQAESFGASMTTMAKAVAGAIAAIQVGNVVSGLIEVQRQYDVMNASLKTLTGSQAEATKEFQRLKEFAATTPYDLEQVVGAFIKLKAMGLDPSQAALASYGNTAAAMGKSLNQLVEAVADAATGEFERLKEFGIRAKSEGETITFTFQGVETQVQNSAQAITGYLQSLGEVNFAGAMADRMATLDGAVSNLEDSFKDLYRAVNESGFGEAVATSVKLATTAISEMTTSIRDGKLTDYFDALKPLITAAEVAVVSLAGAIASKLVVAFAAAATQAYASVTAMGAAAVAARGLGAALTLMGGPIGIAITALGLLVLNWDKVSSQARSAAEISEDSAQRIAKALAKGSAAAQKAALKSSIADYQQELKDANQALINLQVGTYGKGTPQQIEAARERVESLKKAIADAGKAIDDLAPKLNSTAGAGRGSVNPGFTPGTESLEPVAGGGGGKHKFDAEAYLASLRQASLQGLALVDEREKNQLATAQKHYAQGEINLQQHEAAKTEIMRAAEAERSKIYQQNQDAALAAAEQKRRDIEAQAEAQAAAEQAAEEKRQQGRAMAQGLILEEDPVAKLQAELEAKSALLAQYAALDQSNLELYAQAKIALEEQTAQKIKAVKDGMRQQEAAMLSAQLQGYGQLFGSIADMTSTFAGKQSAAYKAMFAVSKAFAIADAVVKIQQGIANAMSLPWPANLAAAASTASTAAGIVSTIKGATFGGGRQYGGPVDAGTMYRVNETGRPEMFTARSGEQYMLPTKNGKVTPANKVGQGGAAAARSNDGPVNINLKGVAMPNGMFAINPGDLADAIRQARRDMFL